MASSHDGRGVDLATLLEANRLHLAEVDAIVETMRQQAMSTGHAFACREGCAACCRFWVECGPLEALGIAHAIRQDGLDSPGLRHRLRRAAELMERHGHEGYWGLARFCPLLSEDKLCLAYDARPAACRVHHAITSPALCERAAGMRLEDPALHEGHAEFCHDATSYLPDWPAFGPLPRMVLRAMDCGIMDPSSSRAVGR